MLKIRYHTSFKRDYKRSLKGDTTLNYWKISLINWRVEYRYRKRTMTTI